MKAPSRQRLWQIKMRAEGRCELCAAPEPHGRAHCDACATRAAARRGDHLLKRRPLASDWQAVDWTLPNTVIAAELDITKCAVRLQRQKRAPESLRRMPRGRPRKQPLSAAAPC